MSKGDQRMNTLAFQTVSGGEVDIQTLIPYSGEEISDCNFQIWWWNPNFDDKKNIIGNEYAVWQDYWYDPDDPNADEDGYCYAEGLEDYKWCWDDTKKDKYSGEDLLPWKWEKTFRVGDGFFCKPLAEDPKLTASGAVLNEGSSEAYYPMVLSKGDQVIIANPFPTALDITTMIPFSGEEISDCNYQIWWWNPNFDDKKNIIGNEYAVWQDYWYDPQDPNADEDGYCYADGLEDYKWCWDDTKKDKYSGENLLPWKWEKTFGASESFFCKPLAEDPVLKFPNPFFKAN